MKFHQFLSVAGCLVLFPLLTAFADDPKSAALMQTLPIDGAWTTFNVNVKFNGQEFAMTGTARSVGRALHDGKQCRFVEYEQTVNAPPPFNVQQLGNLTWRLLVPEEEFGEGKNPLGNASKIWVQYEKREPEVVDSIELKDPIFTILFQGPKNNLKIEDVKEKVVWQQGELQCAVVTGKSELEFSVGKLLMTHRVVQHRDVPFGIAGLRQDLTASFGGQDEKIVIEVSLRDFGKDAKAKLPELVP